MLSRIKLYIKKHYNSKKKLSLITQEALFKAIREKNIAEVEYLLEHGISPNTNYQDDIEGGGVILHWVIKEQNENDTIIKLLLKRGADPNNLDNFGDAPLHLTAQKGYTNIIKILLENGAFIDTQGFGGFTPLEAATMSFSKANFDIVKLLLQYDAKFISKIINNFYRDQRSIIDEKEIALKALLELEHLFRNKKIYKIVEKAYITKAHLEDFVIWKAEAEIPKYIKNNKTLLSKYIYKLFTLNNYLNDDSLMVSKKTKELLEKKIHEYVGNQDLTETLRPVLTLKHFAEFKLIQNPDESKKYLMDNLSLSYIEIITKLEQEYKINISGISDQNEDLYTRFI
ncbi:MULTISPECIES: ankyrin repeat domain-containing protein [unclassified Rickettsia]|uniref:ankyrin repeat domain-containing protein n=1 Tax=unclassified Rickettsia TaxID=114295 RepID=UPI00313298C5